MTEMKKWTEKAVAGIYTTVLPTDLLMTNLDNIIFNDSVRDVSKICR